MKFRTHKPNSPDSRFSFNLTTYFCWQKFKSLIYEVLGFHPKNQCLGTFVFHFADLKFLLLFAKISIASIPIDQSSTKLSDSNARRHMLFLLYHHLDNHEETRQHKNVKSHGSRVRRSHLR